MSLLLGPILHFRGVHVGRYHVSALIVQDKGDPAPPHSVPACSVDKVIRIDEIPYEKSGADVWRIDLSIHQKAGPSAEVCTYAIAGVDGTFHVPAKGVSPRMAYGSCNGFSADKYRKKVKDRQNERWLNMGECHQEKPFNLLVLGGDQVYSDELMVKDGPLQDWSDLWHANQICSPWTPAMEQQVDRFFAELYVKRWNQEGPLQMFRSIPTVMMWDDHDIIDGWGSYPQDLHNCDVHQNLFRIASRYFRLFQQQLAKDEIHPAAVPGAQGYSLGYRDLGELALLVPDLRSERQPDIKIDGIFKPTQIASDETWKATFNWLEDTNTQQHKHLLVFSSIPVAYIDLNAAEKALNALPGQWELEDDLRDHWRSKPHKDERQRLIKRLLNFASRGTRVTLVSGDVHVAAACVIESRLPQHIERGAGVIFQLVSTGVVHTPPPAVVVYFMEKFGASQEVIEFGITATMLPIGYQGHYLVPERNWLSLEPDTKGRIWANWHVEGHDHLLTQVIDPIPAPHL
ncbi:phosphodiesterase/alkaline phosphatase D [Pseudomonas sp. GM102]|uniref:alkaline phosphatase D family protein n=1 Tax=Pseudomonas sp. GM102 TaxID=1144321 RepID=UPI00026FC56A|nr:alkaline phosphatase D family protein [Pseudomonas sp. GM102]EJM07354.1 phosphodiesterase/alkaline phosphatase D [Pseudomonas sp. GM102]